MTSPTQWTWVWVNSGSWWRTGRPGVLRFTGSQRVGHDWVAELNWLLLRSWWKVSLRLPKLHSPLTMMVLGFLSGSVVKNPLPVQETRVRSLVQENPTGHRATTPVRHYSWACPLEPVLRSKRSQRSEKPSHQTREKPEQQWRPRGAENKSNYTHTHTHTSLIKKKYSKIMLLVCQNVSFVVIYHSK